MFQKATAQLRLATFSQERLVSRLLLWEYRVLRVLRRSYNMIPPNMQLSADGSARTFTLDHVADSNRLGSQH